MHPDFSIVIPVYKVEEYLRACVDSILSQTHAALELILVDDGSPDGSGAICDEYAAADPRVRVIHGENAGPSAARYAGLCLASADYVSFVDGDDWVAPNWLETIRRLADENDSPDMLLYSLVWAYDDGRREEHVVAIGPGLYDKARLEAEVYPRMLYDRDQPFLRKALQGHMCSRVTKRQLLLDHFVSDSGINRLEDDAMMYECLYFADSLYICPGQFYFYRQRGTSSMGSYHADSIGNTAALCRYLQSHLGVYSEDISLQINAYIAYWAIRNIAEEFRHGRSLRQVAGSVRRQMRDSGLAGLLRLEGLPAHIALFVLLLKLRLYAVAALLTRMRM